jgi:hypothetical protein
MELSVIPNVNPGAHDLPKELVHILGSISTRFRFQGQRDMAKSTDGQPEFLVCRFYFLGLAFRVSNIEARENIEDAHHLMLGLFHTVLQRKISQRPVTGLQSLTLILFHEAMTEAIPPSGISTRAGSTRTSSSKAKSRELSCLGLAVSQR